MKPKQIVLTDSDGNTRFFDEADLSVQLLAAGLLGNGAVKSAAQSLATTVQKMRQAQKRPTLFDAKKLESQVDGLLNLFNPTIERL